MSDWLDITMNYLRKSEGGFVHRNSNEKDITNSYGIYKYAFPRADVFVYYDSIMKRLGITKNSKLWTREDLNKLNANIDKNAELGYSRKFYQDYFAKLYLDLFKEPMVLPMVSIYSNSPLLCVKALQRAINDLLDKGILKGFDKLVVDGSYGGKTKYAVIQAKELSDNDYQTFKTAFLDNCDLEYELLVKRKPSLGIYLKGWHNRVKGLR